MVFSMGKYSSTNDEAAPGEGNEIKPLKTPSWLEGEECKYFHAFCEKFQNTIDKSVKVLVLFDADIDGYTATLALCDAISLHRQNTKCEIKHAVLTNSMCNKLEDDGSGRLNDAISVELGNGNDFTTVIFCDVSPMSIDNEKRVLPKCVQQNEHCKCFIIDEHKKDNDKDFLNSNNIVLLNNIGDEFKLATSGLIYATMQNLACMKRMQQEADRANEFDNMIAPWASKWSTLLSVANYSDVGYKFKQNDRKQNFKKIPLLPSIYERECEALQYTVPDKLDTDQFAPCAKYILSHLLHGFYELSRQNQAVITFDDDVEQILSNTVTPNSLYKWEFACKEEFDLQKIANGFKETIEVIRGELMNKDNWRPCEVASAEIDVRVFENKGIYEKTKEMMQVPWKSDIIVFQVYLMAHRDQAEEVLDIENLKDKTSAFLLYPDSSLPKQGESLVTGCSVRRLGPGPNNDVKCTDILSAKGNPAAAGLTARITNDSGNFTVTNAAPNASIE